MSDGILATDLASMGATGGITGSCTLAILPWTNGIGPREGCGMSIDMRTYPQGVPCWVDTEQPDPEAASGFYGTLFGWTFENVMPPGAPSVYLIAKLHGHDVCAIGEGTARWNTYIAVNDADAVAAEIQLKAGRVLVSPQDAGPGGRLAICA